MPCPEVVAVFYIKSAEVPTLLSVEGDAQVERPNTVVGFLTNRLLQYTDSRHCLSFHWSTTLTDTE